MSGGERTFCRDGGELRMSAAASAEVMRAVLGRGAAFRFRARGASMHPWIRDGDTVTVAPAAGRAPALGDVIAFAQQGTGKLLIHRVVGRHREGVVTKGDNCREPDGPVASGELLGRVVKVERGGRRQRFGLGVERRVLAILLRKTTTSALARLVRPASGHRRRRRY